jgi:uncharacterized protein
VPFIARYRKEVTGGMSDTQLRELTDRLPYLRELEERRAAILLEIETQGKLTPALRQSIVQADTKQSLEDLYAPYKPKRRTRAMIAKEAGLEPLAVSLFNHRHLDPSTAAVPFVKADILTVKAALDGARDILAEQFSEHPNAVTTVTLNPMPINFVIILNTTSHCSRCLHTVYWRYCAGKPKAF